MKINVRAKAPREKISLNNWKRKPSVWGDRSGSFQTKKVYKQIYDIKRWFFKEILKKTWETFAEILEKLQYNYLKYFEENFGNLCRNFGKTSK